MVNLNRRIESREVQSVHCVPDCRSYTMHKRKAKTQNVDYDNRLTTFFLSSVAKE